MIIYKITNLINGKIYVGRTTKKFEDRLYQHKHNTTSLIGQDIQKYHWENFRAEIIEKCNSFEELVNREIYWIKKLDCTSPKGYNANRGGGGIQSLHEEIYEFDHIIFYMMEFFRPKWKLPIIWYIGDNENIRYNELQRKVVGITSTMLSKCLRELERDHLIKRKQYMTIPPAVEYSLTDLGKSLVLALGSIYKWAEEQMKHT